MAARCAAAAILREGECCQVSLCGHLCVGCRTCLSAEALCCRAGHLCLPGREGPGQAGTAAWRPVPGKLMLALPKGCSYLMPMAAELCFHVNFLAGRCVPKCTKPAPLCRWWVRMGTLSSGGLACAWGCTGRQRALSPTGRQGCVRCLPTPGCHPLCVQHCPVTAVLCWLAPV